MASSLSTVPILLIYPQPFIFNCYFLVYRFMVVIITDAASVIFMRETDERKTRELSQELLRAAATFSLSPQRFIHHHHFVPSAPPTQLQVCSHLDAFLSSFYGIRRYHQNCWTRSGFDAARLFSSPSTVFLRCSFSFGVRSLCCCSLVRDTLSCDGRSIWWRRLWQS